MNNSLCRNAASVPLFLAPMAGEGDAVFRKICRAYGADGATSEMISAKGLFYGDKTTAQLAKIDADDMPLAIQIFGHEPDIMASAAARFASGDYPGGCVQRKPCAVDINMGCPVKKVVSNGDGSALGRDIALAAKVAAACVKACENSGVPVTAKIRSGWDGEHINAPELARALEASGVAAITVHGRTREMQYSGKADYAVIARVKAAVSVPVYGNGDVRCPSDAAAMLEQTGADGIAIARGALGRPWVFEDVKTAFAGGIVPTRSAEFVCECAIDHARRFAGVFGTGSMRHVRTHMAAYLRGFDGAASMRAEIMTASTLSQLEEIISRGAKKFGKQAAMEIK